MREWEFREPIAKLGDIIQIRGYGSRKFEVFSISYAVDIDVIDMFEDVFYDVAALDSHDYMLACQEDIIVLETPTDVDYDRLEEYLVRQDYAESTILKSLGLDGYEVTEIDEQGSEQDNEQEEEGVVDKREEIESRTDKVDRLLTELYDYYTLIGLVGGDYEEGDGHYRRKIDDIEAELKELTGGEAE